MSAQLIQWSIHHARYSHTQNVVAGAVLALSFVHHFSFLLCCVWILFFLFFASIFSLFVLFSFLTFCAFSSFIAFPFLFHLLFCIYVCFFSQLPKQNAEQFRAFVKTACSSRPKLLLFMVVQNQQSRPSDCAVMELHSCHFHAGSDLAKLFSV